MTPEAADLSDGSLDAGDPHRSERSVTTYLARTGIGAATVETPDLSTLRRLQRAHVTAAPFETLSIAGDYRETGHEGHPLHDGPWRRMGVRLQRHSARPHLGPEGPDQRGLWRIVV